MELLHETHKFMAIVDKLDSPHFSDSLASLVHCFSYRGGDRFKSTVFKYDEVMRECSQYSHELLDFSNCGTL